MNTEKAQALLTKYGKGELNAEEEVLLNQWYLSTIAESKEALTEEELNESYFFLKANLPLAEEPKKIKWWPRIGAVAAAVATITLGVWLYYASNLLRHPDAGQHPSVARNDIKPGGHRATITLANGKVINLSEAKTGVVTGKEGISYSDGDSLLSGAYVKMQTLTASTPIGGTYDFVLPDGSKVYLNASTTIKFPSAFDKGNRMVELVSGEAYFEVTKDKKRPFIVKNEGQTVEVLGTHFNINAYEEEKCVRTTLIEGRVTVNGKVTLAPGEQSALYESGQIVVSNVVAEDYIDWKNGDFVFDNASLEEIMNKIARWYDVKITYQAGVDKKQLFGGKVSRNKPISAVLKSMQSTGKLKFRLTDNNLLVLK